MATRSSTPCWSRIKFAHLIAARANHERIGWHDLLKIYPVCIHMRSIVRNIERLTPEDKNWYIQQHNGTLPSSTGTDSPPVSRPGSPEGSALNSSTATLPTSSLRRSVVTLPSGGAAVPAPGGWKPTKCTSAAAPAAAGKRKQIALRRTFSQTESDGDRGKSGK
eukprot:SAG11_NODE_4693_length_1803_cov_1.841549_1_plen_164_part_00